MATKYSITKNPAAIKLSRSKDPSATGVLITKQPGSTQANFIKTGGTKVYIGKNLAESVQFVPSLKSVDTLSALAIGTNYPAGTVITADTLQKELPDYARGIIDIDDTRFASGDRSIKCTAVLGQNTFGCQFNFDNPQAIQGVTHTVQWKTWFPTGWDRSTPGNDQWKFLRSRRVTSADATYGDFDILYSYGSDFILPGDGATRWTDTRSGGFGTGNATLSGITGTMVPDQWQTWTYQCYHHTTDGWIKLWLHTPTGAHAGSQLLLDIGPYGNIFAATDKILGYWLCDYWNSNAQANQSMWTDSWYITDEAVSPFPFSGGFPVVL